MALSVGLAGLRNGLLIGVEPPSGGGSPGVPSDSGIYFPTSEAHYSSMSVPVPTHRYECDEVSGSILDREGSNDLASTGTHTYQFPMPNFTSRVGVGVGDNPTNSIFQNGGGLGAAGAGTSIAVYVVFDVPSALGGGRLEAFTAILNKLEVGVSTAGYAEFTFNGSAVAGATDYRGSKLGLLAVWDKSAGTVKMYSPDDELSHSYVASVTDSVNRMGGVLDPVHYPVGKVDIWVGTDAEGMDKNTLAAYGWTLSY